MKFALKLLFGLAFAGCALVLIAAGFLHGWVVPHMDDLRPRIETYLSEKTGHTIRIGQITAESSGYLPSFDLQNVEVQDSQKTSAQPNSLLKLGRVQVAVSPLSLLTLEIDKLTIDAPLLTVSRDAAGVLTVAGFKLAKQEGPSPALDWVFSQKEIAIRGGTIVWTDAMPHLFTHANGNVDALPSATISNVDFSLKNGLRSHNIELKAAPPVAFGQSVQVSGKFSQPLLEQHAGKWQVWTGDIDARMENIPGVAKSVKASINWPLKSTNVEGEMLALSKMSQIAQSVGYPVPDTWREQSAYAALQTTHVERFKLQAKDIGTEKLEAFVDAKLDNADLAGDIKLTWKKEGNKLDATSNLTRLDLAAIYRYVPLQAPSTLRPLLQNAIQKGVASDIRVVVKGALKDIPLINAAANGKAGELRMSGKVSDADFTIPQKPEAIKVPWSNLKQTHFNFDLNGSQLDLKNITSEFANLSGKGSARIANLKNPVFDANFDLAGSMTSALAVLKVEPLKSLTKDALLTSEGTGNITSTLQLSVPLSAPAQSKVSGIVQLPGNDFALNSNIPKLADVKGKINFSQTGFQLNTLQANLFGGEMKLSGNAQKITGAGTLSVESLAASAFMPLRAQLGNRVKGKTNYTFSLEPNLGGSGLIIESNLSGIQIDLPAPLDKPASSSWPLRVQQVKTSNAQDRLLVSLSHLVNAEFVRDISGGVSKPAVVQRGSMMLASNPNYVSELVLPPQGVSAMLRSDFLDIAQWTPVLGLDKLDSASDPSGSAASYIPSQLAAQLETLRFANRSFTQVVLGASRVGRTWRINANASDFNGYGEYRQTANDQTGQIYLRLAKLILPDASSKTQIEQLLQNAPDQIPALDVIIDDFEVTGRKVGRVELTAINQRSQTSLGRSVGQEWRVQKLNITNPEATLAATGAWLPSNEAVGSANPSRRVDLQFNLDIADSGALLERFGSLGTLKGGKGSLQGRVAWVGSPWSINIPTLAGQLKMDMSKGQFLKIEPGKAGRFMNVLSLQALPRLLTLDFRDVFSEGFAFDSLGGDAQIANGVLSSQNLQMKSVLALVSLDGSVDLARETQSLRVLVLPDINAGGASLIATLINPVVGAATYLAQLVLRRPVIAAATKEYSIQGSWAEPKITQIKRSALSPTAPAAPALPGVAPAEPITP